MCRQGGENIHAMTKDTFQLHYDIETGISYVKKVKDEMQKNHQECDNEIITDFMPQLLIPDGTVHNLCPVQAFENYISKLHPDNHSLWQKPLCKIPKDASSPWYEKTIVGHNTHEKSYLIKQSCPRNIQITASGSQVLPTLQEQILVPNR